MAPSEALANNSQPFAALQKALNSGKIAKVLELPVRESAPGARSFRQVTPALLAEMTADYRAGQSVYAIAERHGLHRYTVTEHLKAAGVVMRRTITEAERRRALELYDSGANFTDIARTLGRDPATVKKVIRAAGPPDRASPSGPTRRTKAGPAPDARSPARAS